jgi:site-specific DNA-methyltransferase (adenine-specific)
MSASLNLNVAQRGDALALLRSLLDSCSPLVFFDPQYRGILDEMDFGNEGARQRGRAGLRAMTGDYIDSCCRESARVLRPGGYLMLWGDTFNVLQAHHLRISEANTDDKTITPERPFKSVDMIAWDNEGFGMGKRSRRCGDYLLILQRPPLRPKSTWCDHKIRSRWREKIEKPRSQHPHIKPIGLIKRLIGAVTKPGERIIDPAAGSFVVMRAAHELGRDFIGCDIAYQPDTGRAERIPAEHIGRDIYLPT